MSGKEILTIGHSNHPWERFVALLHGQGITALADVRSRPYSRFPWFHRGKMERALPAAGVAYHWLGAELGGKPADPGLLGADGRPDYAAMAAQPAFREGLARLTALLEAPGVPAMMCAEGDPAGCHREHLIAPALRQAGVRVIHVLPDGSRLLV